MKQLKKGLRFNAETRAAVIVAVINDRMGTAVENLQIEREEVTDFIEQSLFGLAIDSTVEMDVSDVPENLLPTIDIYTYVAGTKEVGSMHVPDVAKIKLSRDIKVPYPIFTEVDRSFRRLTDLEKDKISKFAELSRSTLDKKKLMTEKLQEHLNGFTSPAKLVPVSPELEKYFPEDFYDEDSDVSQVSLDDILAA